MSANFDDRLRQVEDKLALYDLMHDYQRLGDERRYKDWAECWTEDAVFENSFGSLKGKQEIFEACDGQMKVFQDQEHVIGNTRFRISGDEATGTGVLIFIGVPKVKEPGEFVITGGHYDWRFRLKWARRFTQSPWTESGSTAFGQTSRNCSLSPKATGGSEFHRDPPIVKSAAKPERCEIAIRTGAVIGDDTISVRIDIEQVVCACRQGHIVAQVIADIEVGHPFRAKAPVASGDIARLGIAAIARHPQQRMGAAKAPVV